jgi:3,4-dihydroxy 2-butanone 4-phosphate synthase/GTP cyclohydrolase II
LDKLRHLAQTNHLLLKEEARPVGVALFGTPSLTFHLGFDQADLAIEGWYQDQNHPYVQAVTQLLDALSIMPQVNRLEFMVANGADPLTGLQIQLDRHVYPKSQLPSTLISKLELQVIYSFI